MSAASPRHAALVASPDSADTTALKSALTHTLVHTGLADDLKAQVRAFVAKRILGEQGAAGERGRVGDAGKTEDGLSLSLTIPSTDIRPTVGDLVVEEYLQAVGANLTLAVFAAERRLPTVEHEAAAGFHRLRALADVREGTHARSDARQQDARNGSVLTALYTAALEDNNIASGSRRGLTEPTPPNTDTHTRSPPHARAHLDDTAGLWTHEYLERRMRELTETIESRARVESARGIRQAASHASYVTAAEERARFENEIAAMALANEEVRRAVTRAAAEELHRRTKEVSDMREGMQREAAAMRARLLTELEAVAARSAALERSAAVDAREAALARDVADESVRKLTARLRDAEEAARHAESKAALSFERWKTDHLLELQSRESAIMSSEQRIRDERAALELQRRELQEAATRAPLLDQKVATLNAEVEALRTTATSASAHQAALRTENERLQRALETQTIECRQLAAQLAAVRERASMQEHEVRAAQANAETSMDEWVAAVRLLRDKLKIATKRLKEEAQLRASDAAAAERQLRLSLREQEQAWRSRLEEVAALKRQVEARIAEANASLAAETRRADEAAAAMAGMAAKVDSLERALASARAAASSTSAASITRSKLASTLRTPAALPPALPSYAPVHDTGSMHGSELRGAPPHLPAGLPLGAPSADTTGIMVPWSAAATPPIVPQTAAPAAPTQAPPIAPQRRAATSSASTLSSSAPRALPAASGASTGLPAQPRAASPAPIAALYRSEQRASVANAEAVSSALVEAAKPSTSSATADASVVSARAASPAMHALPGKASDKSPAGNAPTVEPRGVTPPPVPGLSIAAAPTMSAADTVVSSRTGRTLARGASEPVVTEAFAARAAAPVMSSRAASPAVSLSSALDVASTEARRPQEFSNVGRSHREFSSEAVGRDTGRVPSPAPAATYAPMPAVEVALSEADFSVDASVAESQREAAGHEADEALHGASMDQDDWF